MNNQTDTAGGNLARAKAPWFHFLILLSGLMLVVFSSGCLEASQTAQVQYQEQMEGNLPELSSADNATLNSLQQVDEYPLYTMQYQGDYWLSKPLGAVLPVKPRATGWACSLFAVLGDPQELLLGRNFDWDFSPGLLLYTNPPHGYASVSMVDLYYLGFGNDLAYGVSELPLENRVGLLDAPYLPFDGMNETGLVVSMAAVPERNMPFDPANDTVDSLLVIRKILDNAATIEDAVAIFKDHNIDWGGGPALHYLIADGTGRSAVIEFSDGKMHVIENQGAWQAATNFLISESVDQPDGMGWRYPLISDRLQEQSGKIDPGGAMDLLSEAAQGNTQWSVVYQINTGEVQVAMGRKYHQIHVFNAFLP